MAVHDSRVRNLTAWRLTNDRTTPGQKANIATEFAGRDVPKMKFLFTVSFEFGKTLQGISSNPDFDSTLQFKPNPGSDEMASIEYACKNGDVQTGSGDVNATTISGSVRTGSGDIKYKGK